MPRPPQAVIIAGPNGSGKSTAATTLLPAHMTFVNADMIAQELTGKPGTSADINAGRILLDKVVELERNLEDFAFETTLATKMLVSRVEEWSKSGFEVHLIFFWLPSPELSIQRVAGRVRDGGHDVPEDTIRRRFRTGLRNLFRIYMPVVTTWRMYDNSGGPEPKLIAKGTRKGSIKVKNEALWQILKEEYGI